MATREGEVGEVGGWVEERGSAESDCRDAREREKSEERQRRVTEKNKQRDEFEEEGRRLAKQLQQVGQGLESEEKRNVEQVVRKVKQNEWVKELDRAVGKDHEYGRKRDREGREEKYHVVKRNKVVSALVAGDNLW